MIQPAFRPATPDDAGTLAELVQFASEGLALYLWTQIAGAGHDPWNIGRERVRSESYGVSYKNAIIAELSGQPTSALRSAIDRKPFPTSSQLCSYRCTSS